MNDDEIKSYFAEQSKLSKKAQDYLFTYFKTYFGNELYAFKAKYEFEESNDFIYCLVDTIYDTSKLPDNPRIMHHIGLYYKGSLSDTKIALVISKNKHLYYAGVLDN